MVCTGRWETDFFFAEIRTRVMRGADAALDVLIVMGGDAVIVSLSDRKHRRAARIIVRSLGERKHRRAARRLLGRRRDGASRRLALLDPLPRHALFDQRQPQQDVQRDQPEAHVVDRVVAGLLVHDAAEHGADEDAGAPAQGDGAHGRAHARGAERVDHEGQAHDPHDRRGEALQDPRGDEHADAAAQAEHHRCAEEKQEAGEEGVAAGGGAVGDPAGDRYGLVSLANGRRGVVGRAEESGETNEKNRIGRRHRRRGGSRPSIGL